MLLPPQPNIDLLTAASAQSMRLIMALAEAGGSLRYYIVSPAFRSPIVFAACGDILILN
jgi:hypothetical protein